MRKILISILFCVLLLVTGGTALAQGGGAGWFDFVTDVRLHGQVWILNDLTIGDDLTLTDDLTADAISAADITASDDVTVTDDLIVTGLINQDVNEENIGIMSIMTASVEYTDTAALFTVGASEIWIVHDVLVNVTENYDCTGNDCGMEIGDSNDPDGFVVLADAQLQAADTEFTGAEAGWQGMAAATKGVYLDEVTTNSHHNFVYSGSETIDLDVTGTSPAGGAATIYILYTRIQ